MKKAILFIKLLTALVVFTQAAACLFGVGTGRTKSGVQLHAGDETRVTCQVPYSNLTAYVFPGFKLGCWLTEPTKEL